MRARQTEIGAQGEPLFYLALMICSITILFATSR